MSPRLSPKKTVEGGVGGVVAAVLAAWVFLRLIMPRLVAGSSPDFSHAAILVYGVSLAVAGMFGDLSVSLIKRDLAQKDSSCWLPGLGGLLDVMDSIFWAAPVAYVWWVAMEAFGRMGQNVL